ncbi:MAG TPA: hypothetical protein VHQ90_00055 [Thermoanaerobaculia bacterium]|nr:hypothetical protein [Thermoanaerobaculia bacterium]
MTDTPANPDQPAPGNPADPTSPPLPPVDPPASSGTPATALHGDENPETAGNVWSGPALSERPGDHAQPPDGWENPPALELHGPSTPADNPVWTPAHGGTSGPYDLARNEVAPPEGYVNPPAVELHGSSQPAA